ncbi:MAG TPA: M48 family metalloprotease [Smithella sp.]|nr:M48 family metalloprotease [Smithella sp.]
MFFVALLWAKPCRAEFTIDDEKKLGKEFYQKLEESHLIYKNKSLCDYINRIGNRILAQTKKAPFDFNFYIVDSSAINAFATPGGYIYINKGLILAAKSEAELAGVIAHEVGHANARHIASLIEKSKKLNVAALTAVLASILLGGGETSGAIAAFSLAGSSSLTLKYMREHEEEADRLGIQYLVGAGYDPMSMIDFLKMMKQYEFLSKTMPSYLQTHPGTDNRIYYLDSLITSQKLHNGAKNIIGNFKRIQSTIPLDATSLNYRYDQLSKYLLDNPDDTDTLYGLALIEDQLGQTDSAIQHYQKILNLSPHDADALQNIGVLFLKTGKPHLAVEHLARASKLYPQNDTILFNLGRAYFATGNFKKALECYLQIQDKKFDDADVNYFIAMTYGRLNNRGESHYYFGLHFNDAQKVNSALFHFKEALNYFPKSSARYESITQAIKELEEGKSKKTK